MKKDSYEAAQFRYVNQGPFVCGKWSRILQRLHRRIDPDIELSDSNIDQHRIAEDHGVKMRRLSK